MERRAGFRVFVLSAALVAGAALEAGAPPYSSEGFLEIPSSVALEAVSGVALGPAGQVYVLHRGEPPLLAFDKGGKYSRGWGQGLFAVAHGLRVDAQGNIWATDNKLHVVYKFSPQGELLQTLGEKGEAGAGETRFRSPDDLVFAANGDIYIADAGNGRIVRLSAAGKFLGQWGSKGKGEGEFAAAHGIAIDARDRIYVADRGNNRIQVFSRKGRFLAAWSGFGNPFGAVVVGDELIVSDGDAHTVSHLRLKDGKMSAQWGGSETLQLPHLMDHDGRGRLYVTEVAGKRVQIFRRAEQSLGIK